jgi:hypothetical protein
MHVAFRLLIFGLPPATGSRVGGVCARYRARAILVDTRNQHALVAAPVSGCCCACSCPDDSRHRDSVVGPAPLAAPRQGAGHRGRACETRLSIHLVVSVSRGGAPTFHDDDLIPILHSNRNQSTSHDDSVHFVCCMPVRGLNNAMFSSQMYFR